MSFSSKQNEDIGHTRFDMRELLVVSTATPVLGLSFDFPDKFVVNSGTFCGANAAT